MAWFVVAVGAAVAGAVQRITGFGAVVVLMSLLPYYFGIVDSPTLALSINLLYTVALLWKFRKYVDLKLAALPTAIYSVLAAVMVGPWYGSAAGIMTGVLRMLCGRDIGSVTGAMFGPILGGLLYRKFGTAWSVWVGEVIGTGVVGAMASYPLMKLFYGLDAQSPFYFIPFYTPSAMMGASMGVAVYLILKRTGVLKRMQQELER